MHSEVEDENVEEVKEVPEVYVYAWNIYIY